MAEERSEEARASGLLYLTIGGEVVEVPVLRIRKAREWKRLFGETELDDGSLDRPVDVMLDLLVAYDVTAALGDRDRLEDRATDREVYLAFMEVVSATFPFVPELPLDLARRMALGLFARGSSTSGDSTPGDSPPTPLRKPSRTNSSSSSMTPVRSA